MGTKVFCSRNQTVLYIVQTQQSTVSSDHLLYKTLIEVNTGNDLSMQPQCIRPESPKQDSPQKSMLEEDQGCRNISIPLGNHIIFVMYLSQASHAQEIQNNH